MTSTGRYTGRVVPAVCLSLLIATATPGQALPPPRDGDIRTLYYELQNQTVVWLTLEPVLASGKPAPAMMLLTLNLEFPGKQPKKPAEHVDLRAYSGMLWAPRIELALALDEGAKISLLQPSQTGLVSGPVSDYLSGTLSLATLKQMADAKRVRVHALGQEFELTDSQREAVRAFLDRVTSADPARPRRR